MSPEPLAVIAKTLLARVRELEGNRCDESMEFIEGTWTDLRTKSLIGAMDNLAASS